MMLNKGSGSASATVVNGESNICHSLSHVNIDWGGFTKDPIHYMCIAQIFTQSRHKLITNSNSKRQINMCEIVCTKSFISLCALHK